MDGEHLWAVKSPLLRLFVFAAVVALECGCGRHVSEPLGHFVEPLDESVVAAAETSPYKQAAERLDDALGAKQALLTRTSYTPAQRAFLTRVSGTALEVIEAGSERAAFVPPGSRGQTEWRLMGRMLAWRLEGQCANQKWADAISTELAMTKFGFGLTAGSPMDASLGLVIVDEGRKTLAPFREQLESAQLKRLAEGTKQIFVSRPKISDCFRIAERAMLQSVQDIQDGYVANDTTPVTKAFGSADKEAVATIQKLHDESDDQRAEFFNGFAAEAKRSAALLVQESELPAAQRDALVKSNPPPKGPWMRLAKRLFDVGRPVLSMNDATCARTKLLILESEIQLSLKLSGSTPADLSRFSRELTLDPYSGMPFIYRTDGQDYKLYSVGEDLVDNDGDTDETFSSPDLVLETSSR